MIGKPEQADEERENAGQNGDSTGGNGFNSGHPMMSHIMPVTKTFKGAAS
jgi:hypothetical protein